jgi:hypothetical protein
MLLALAPLGVSVWHTMCDHTLMQHKFEDANMMEREHNIIHPFGSVS